MRGPSDAIPSRPLGEFARYKGFFAACIRSWSSITSGTSCDTMRSSIPDWQNVAVPYYQIDVVQRDVLRCQTVVDDRLIETGVVAGNPLFAYGERNPAVTKQAGADVVVVGIDPEDINVFLTWNFFVWNLISQLPIF